MELLDGRQVRIRDDAADHFDSRLDDAVDDGFEQGLLRAEVVVEGALRGADGGEDILDAELLVALGGDQLLSGVDELVAA